MGVPGFFRWIYQKFKTTDLVTKDMKGIGNVEALFLDLNGLLHPQCFKTIEDNPELKNLKGLEEKMIRQCVSYMDTVIRHVNPSKLVYIAIDGVAPMSKVKQQRYRRYKKVKDTQLFNSIKRKWNKPVVKEWNNSAITPGTIFLDKIKQAILDYCDTSSYSIIFSSQNTPGEGEHKLIEYIRKHNFLNYMIYGLDADLIFLSIATQKSNIMLLREANQFDRKQTGFNIIKMDTLKDVIFTIFNEQKESISNFPWKTLNKEKILKDFILLYFFLGNDFIPHLPSIDIYHSGSDLIISYYLNILKEKKRYLYDNKGHINTDFFLSVLKQISENEKNNLKQIHDTREQKIVPIYFRNYKREIYKIENMMFSFPDPVQLHKEGYKKRYYLHYEEDNPKQVVQEYLKSISWISQYYLTGLPSWDFHYKYDIAPFSSDLVEYFDPACLNVQFTLGEPLKPFEQLSVVLHPFSFYLLPKHIKERLLREEKAYPKRFEIDLLNKSKYFKTIPLLPKFNVALAKQIVGSVSLSYYERSRNHFEKEFCFQL